jgi:hypothetical protein
MEARGISMEEKPETHKITAIPVALHPECCSKALYWRNTAMSYQNAGAVGVLGKQPNAIGSE